MKRRTLMLLIIVLAALLQQTLPGLAICGGMKPPLLASLALHHALRKGSPDFWMAVGFAAVLQDSLDMGSFGPALIAFPVMGLLAHRIRNEIFSDGLVTQLVLGAAMGLFTALTSLVVLSASGQRDLPAGLAFLCLAGSTVLGLATLPIVSRSINGLEAMIPKRREYGWQ